MVLILMVASVLFFTLTSCGIPTYLVPSESLTPISSAANSVTFSVKYSSENSGSANSDNIGLLLLYEVSSDPKENSKTLDSWYKKNIRLSENDGMPLSQTRIELDTTDKLVIYAFEYDSKRFAPDYSLHLNDQFGQLNAKVTLEYDELKDKIFVQMLDVNDVPVIPSFYYDLNNEVQISEGDYIHIYGAISVQSRNYSNNYWSKDIKYLGSIEIL